LLIKGNSFCGYKRYRQLKFDFRGEKGVEREMFHDVEEKVESAKEEGQGLRQKLSGGFDSLKGKFRHEKQEVQEEAEQKISESQPLEQPAEALQEGKQSLQELINDNLEMVKGKYRAGKQEVQEKASEKISENQPLEQPVEALQQESQSLKQKISGQFQNISGKISQNVESIKGKFLSSKKKVEEEATQKVEEVERLDQPYELLQEQEEKFHTVTEGIDETISELKKEQIGEPLLSSNPFESLGETNLEANEEGSTDIQGKSFIQKFKGGINSTSSMISDKLNVTKEKVMSVFSHQNKENIALLGLVKDIEEKCCAQDENNENA